MCLNLSLKCMENDNICIGVPEIKQSRINSFLNFKFSSLKKVSPHKIFTAILVINDAFIHIRPSTTL